MVLEPVILPSARRHGIADDDIEHAWRNPVRVFPGDEGFVMLIGPSRSGALLEIGVVTGDHGPVIVHAMPARAKYTR